MTRGNGAPPSANRPILVPRRHRRQRFEDSNAEADRAEAEIDARDNADAYDMGDGRTHGRDEW